MAGTQNAAGYYVWEAPGKSVTVHLSLDVIDRMLAEVMRGFGAVPKRGAEVGGVLIGAIEHGDPSVVRIDDFEPVECEYKRGPSYLFMDEDRAAFEAAVRRWQPEDSRPGYAVGLFRSHTRDGMSLSGEDIELMDALFPSPAHVALLIKPYGTKVSTAGFFFREDRNFQDATPLEFPFRRRELTGEDAPPRRSMLERRPRGQREARQLSTLSFPTPLEGYAEREPFPQPASAYAVTMPARSPLRSAVWLPLSFVFLLFGVALGMLIGLTRAAAPASDADFKLGLSVSRADDNLTIKWDRQSAAVKAAQRGVLEIEDGNYTKSVELKPVDLHSGSIIFRNASTAVHFKLTVFPEDRVSVSETADWSR